MASDENFTTFEVSAGTTGVTNTLSVGDTLNHTVQLNVTSFTSNIVVEAEGSLDGANFFVMTPDNTASANFAVSNGQVTLSGTDNFYLNYKNTPLNAIRLNFVSGTGTIVSTYKGIR